MPQTHIKDPEFLFEEADDPEMYDDQCVLIADQRIYIQVSYWKTEISYEVHMSHAASSEGGDWSITHHGQFATFPEAKARALELAVRVARAEASGEMAAAAALAAARGA